MRQKKDECCSGCNKPKPIVNRTHWLCDDCNQLRLHGGNRRQVELNKYKQRMNKLVERRTTTTPIKKTKKQSKIDSDYSKTVKQMTEEREQFCETCGHTHKPLSVSHTISRKRCKEIGRIDLITHKDNLVFECFEAPTSNPTACHNIWELQQLKKYQDINPDMLRKRLSFVKENDPQTFKILIDKLAVTV